MSREALFALALPLCVIAFGCSHPGSDRCSLPPIQAPVLTSTDFSEGADIPVALSCDGSDRLPSLRWEVPPPGVRSFAIRVDDPDAPHGVFHHWLAWDLPASSHGVSGALPPGSHQADNDFGQRGWRGPCPPPGTRHRYLFEVIPLNAVLGLADGTPRATVEHAIDAHRIDDACGYATSGRITGVYRRPEPTTPEPTTPEPTTPKPTTQPR